MANQNFIGFSKTERTISGDSESNRQIKGTSTITRFGYRHSIVTIFWNILVVYLSLASIQLRPVEALTCYETINVKSRLWKFISMRINDRIQGKTAVVTNESWTYCALVPATIQGKEVKNGTQFGLGHENDLLSAYNTAFGMSMDEEYKYAQLNFFCLIIIHLILSDN